MTRAEPGKPGGFHEGPLVLFTGLVMAGAGVGVAHLFFGAIGWSGFVPPGRVATMLAALLSLGLLSSLGHLGRPTRGHRALRRVGKSALSNEVVLVGLGTAVALLASLFPAEGAAGAGLGLASVLLAIPILLSVGFVYRLPGQLTWNGLAPYHPLVLGFGFGLIVLLGWLPEGARARGELLVLSALIMDAVFVWDRARKVVGASGRGVPVHPRLLDQRISALALRVLLGILLPAAALLSGWQELVVLSLFLNLFLDRFLFYGLAVRETTEAEVMKAEMALLAGLPSPADPSLPADEG
jgi:DMSO reductase anchor subunit